MAEALVLNPAQDPDAPLDAAAIRSRLEQLSQSRRGGEEAPAAEEADAVPGLGSEYEVALQAVDEWDSSAAAIATDDLDAYLEWLRKEVSLAEEKNQKLFDEIGVVGETADNDMIQLDADIEALESSLWKLDSKGLSHLEGTPVAGLSDSTDSCRNQSNVDKDYKYEVLELDHQVGKSEVGLKLLQNLQWSYYPTVIFISEDPPKSSPFRRSLDSLRLPSEGRLLPSPTAVNQGRQHRVRPSVDGLPPSLPAREIETAGAPTHFDRWSFAIFATFR